MHAAASGDMVVIAAVILAAATATNQACGSYGPDLQLIPAPPDNRTAAEHATWLGELCDWRRACRASLGLNDSIFGQPALRWTQTAYITVQMHPFDTYFYASGNYTVQRWLSDLGTRYGGVDAALVWPTYPQLGYDDRSAFDMVTLLPGGLDGVRAVVRSCTPRAWPCSGRTTRGTGAPRGTTPGGTMPSCSRPSTPPSAAMGSTATR